MEEENKEVNSQQALNLNMEGTTGSNIEGTVGSNTEDAVGSDSVNSVGSNTDPPDINTCITDSSQSSPLSTISAQITEVKYYLSCYLASSYILLHFVV